MILRLHAAAKHWITHTNSRPTNPSKSLSWKSQAVRETPPHTLSHLPTAATSLIPTPDDVLNSFLYATPLTDPEASEKRGCSVNQVAESEMQERKWG